jgi:hypothetical protein
MRARRILQAFGTCTLVAATGGAAAQDLGGYYGGMAFGGLVTNQTSISQSAIGDSLARETRRPAQPADAGAALKLGYTPSLARRRANLASFVSKLRTGDPQGAAALEQLTASTDLIEAIGGELARYGLRVDDVADAYAAWWVAAWQGWAGDSSDPTRAQLSAVRAQAARALSTTPQFVTPDEATRQELAESLLVQAALIGAMTEQLKTDPATKPQLRQAMDQAGRSMGLDFATMRLTDSGFDAVAAPAARSEAPAPGRAERRGGDVSSAISAVVFRMWGDLQYRPTVLLRDGSTFDVEGPSMESTSMGASRAADPTRWGRWRATGDRYSLIDEDGRSSDHVLGDGGLFRTFPASPGKTLSRRYKSVTGSQMGEMSMLSTGVMTFSPDGRFTTARSFSASGSGDTTGVSMAGGSASRNTGRYTLTGHRIVLRFDDGTTKDLFFGFGGQGRPQRVDRDMIFIGATAYVEDD